MKGWIEGCTVWSSKRILPVGVARRLHHLVSIANQSVCKMSVNSMCGFFNLESPGSIVLVRTVSRIPLMTYPTINVSVCVLARSTLESPRTRQCASGNRSFLIVIILANTCHRFAVTGRSETSPSSTIYPSDPR